MCPGPQRPTYLRDLVALRGRGEDSPRSYGDVFAAGVHSGGIPAVEEEPGETMSHVHRQMVGYGARENRQMWKQHNTTLQLVLAQ